MPFPLMKILVGIIIFLVSTTANSACVILLHGLARTEGSMENLEHSLVSEGYQTVNLGYPSREHDIEQLAEEAITPALEECHSDEDVNFVTHSLGGILVRQYLSTKEIPNLKYVVMLGPPNMGSEVVDKLNNVPGFKIINGDAGMQLGTGELSVPNSLGPATFDVGIIAGNKSINLFLSYLIPGTDDGKVSIESTRLKGMNDHIEIPTTHTFMMTNDEVISQVIYYLKNGSFERNTNDN